MSGDLCKYVMLNKTEPVIFRAPLKHINIKELLTIEGFLAHSKITSAAFFMVLEDGTVITFSESTSLEMTFAPNDAAIIEKFLKGER